MCRYVVEGACSLGEKCVCHPTPDSVIDPDFDTLWDERYDVRLSARCTRSVEEET